MQPKGVEDVSSVLKVFAILEIIGEKKSFGVTELARQIAMSKSTVYRFLQTMKSLGYVKQDEDDSDNYSLTLKLFSLGAKALQYQNIITIADHYMRTLAEKTRETVHLAARERDHIVYIHKIDSEYSLRMHSRIGLTRSIYSTALGKLFLAWLPEDEIKTLLKQVQFIKYTDNTIDTMAGLLANLAEVRETGYAADREEMEPGLSCFAVPIYNRHKDIIYTISVSQPTMRLADEPALISLLKETAAHISTELEKLPFAPGYAAIN